MKLLIIEGTDCVGKSTIIQQLVKYYDEYNITIRHFGRPKGNNVNLFQYNAFLNEVKIVNDIYNNDINFHRHYKNIIIWNRSHIGEYVYGQLYRNVSEENALKLIDIINNKLNNIDTFNNDNIDIKVIYLYASSELLAKKEDGESISKKKEDKEKELLLFNNIIDKINYNKIKIDVSNNNEFRNINDIFTEITQFINE